MTEKRRTLNLTIKLASALLALGEITYEEAKALSAEQINSLYQFDHYPIRHEDGGPLEPWNLVPRLIMAHREKTAKIDIPEIAHDARLRDKLAAFNSRMAAKDAGEKPPVKRSRWPSRKGTLRSRGFRT